MKSKIAIFTLGALLLGIAYTVRSYAGKHSVTKVVTLHKNNHDKGWLGVYLKDANSIVNGKKKNSENANGAYVESIVEDSPAEKAGLQEGDVITKFNDTQIDDASDLTEAIRDAKPDEEVKLQVKRDGETKDITATLSATSDNFTATTPMALSRSLAPMRMSIALSGGTDGLTIQDLNEQFADFLSVPSKKGVLVTEVEEESEAAKAGLKAGDVITKVGDKKISSVNKFNDELEKLDNGDQVTLEVVRKGATQTVTMKVEKGENYSSAMSLPHMYDFNINDDGNGEHSMKFMEAPNGMNREQLDELRENLDNLKKELKRLKKELKIQDKDGEDDKE